MAETGQACEGGGRCMFKEGGPPGSSGGKKYPSWKQGYCSENLLKYREKKIV